MITRRKLLAWFGLGGAAAVVASKAEAAALPALEPTIDASDWRTPVVPSLDWLGPSPEQAMRRTGRTTRQLLEAVELARQGKSVAFVAECWQLAAAARQLVFRHARGVSGDGTRNAITVLCERGRARGRLVIVANDEPRWPMPAALRGYSEVVYDHGWSPRVGAPRDSFEDACEFDLSPIGTVEGFGMEPGTAWVRALFPRWAPADETWPALRACEQCGLICTGHAPRSKRS